MAAKGLTEAWREWSAARLVALAAGLASIGVLISGGDPLGVLVGAPVLLAAILRAFGLRDLGDFN